MLRILILRSQCPQRIVVSIQVHEGLSDDLAEPLSVGSMCAEVVMDERQWGNALCRARSDYRAHVRRVLTVNEVRADAVALPVLVDVFREVSDAKLEASTELRLDLGRVDGKRSSAALLIGS
jgi:hypothetical protein